VPSNFLTDVRDRELERLLAMIEPLEGPTIVAGDFNSAAKSRAHRRLTTELRDAYEASGAGLGLTFPSRAAGWKTYDGFPFPRIRIDYVFLRGSVEPVHVRALAISGSDHEALVADLALVRR
jgi:vancomycin resistance protein VanJ